MRRALGLAMVLMLIGAGVVAADAFPLSGPGSDLPRGNGWRVIYADFPAHIRHAYRIELAADRDGYYRLWDDVAGLTDFAPYVNFEWYTVALFGTGTNSCTASVSFDAVVFDGQGRLVHSVISETKTCPFLDLSSSAVFLVAIARDRLPDSPFRLQLGREPLCPGCADSSDSITVDL